MFSKTAEKGQALVLIALAAIGLFAFTALAIDGGAVFSDRRHAQNAADTGALAAALARIRENPPTPANWKQAGYDRIESNGYLSDGVTNVAIYTCLEWKTSPDNPTGADCKALPAGAKPEEYIYVRIKSVVNMTFARIIGRQQVTNYTNAIVHAAPVQIEEWFDGNAMVAANRGCPAPGDFGPMTFGGSSNTTVHASGIFVNSSCSPALIDNGSGNSIKTTTAVCSIGDIQTGANGFFDQDGHPQAPLSGTANCGEQVDINDYWMPDTDPSLLAPSCSTPGSITGSHGVYTATPGHYSGRPFPDVTPAGTLYLQKGIYCLDDGFNVNSNWIVTTDRNDSRTHDPVSEGVFFYIRGGDFTLNGSGGVNLHAMDDTTGGIPLSLLHYLIYIPASNPANVDISGDGDTAIVGMILAPTSNIDISGSSRTETFNLSAQIIGNNIRLSGNGFVDITYNPHDQPPAIKIPTVSLTGN